MTTCTADHAACPSPLPAAPCTAHPWAPRKVPVVGVTITDAESGDLIGRTFTSFAAADAAIKAAMDGDWSCKVWFTVTWADGESYSGRHDVWPGDNKSDLDILAAHVAGYIGNCTVTMRDLAKAMGHSDADLDALTALVRTHQIRERSCTLH